MHPRGPVPHVTHHTQGAARGRLGRMAERLLAPLMLPFALLAAFAAFLATRTSMPGVTVETGARPGPSELQTNPGSTYFVAGITERGATDEAILVRSMAEYAEKCGARVTYGAVYDDLEMFFAEGGERAYVARAVGETADSGTLTLVDRAGTPLDTLTLDAVNEGAWSTQIEVAVENGTLTNTFRILIYLNDELVEVYNDLTSPAVAATAINARSQYVTATNEGSATSAPGNNPAVLAATALSAGDDDRAGVSASDLVSTLDRFTPDLGSGAVAIPGQASTAVGAGIIAHCIAHRRIGLLAPAAASTTGAAKSEAGALRTTTGAEYAGLFYPWVKVPDGAGGTRTISPEGYIAAVRARAHRLEGPYRAPAGELAIARHVTGLEKELTRSEIDSLADDSVNSIRLLAGAIRNYGWRSLSRDTSNYRMLTARDTLNYVAGVGEVLLEQYVFRAIDGAGVLYSEVEATIRSILDPMRAKGGLFERRDANNEILDFGYSIDTGPSVNTPEVQANNEVRADVGMRVSPTGELIRLQITKVAHAVSL